MKHLVEFLLEEGGSIVVEIDEPETGGTVRAGREDKIEKARETFEDALNKVLPATKTVVEKLRDMASKPDEIEVTFGPDVTGRLVSIWSLHTTLIGGDSDALGVGMTYFQWDNVDSRTAQEQCMRECIRFGQSSVISQ